MTLYQADRGVYQLPDRREVYLAFRKISEMFRGGALQRYLPLDKFLISLGSVRGIKAKKPRKAA